MSELELGLWIGAFAGALVGVVATAWFKANTEKQEAQRNRLQELAGQVDQALVAHDRRLREIEGPVKEIQDGVRNLRTEIESRVRRLEQKP
jgi:hypothetical protein